MVCKTITRKATPPPLTSRKKHPDWTLICNHLPLLKSIIGKMSPNFPPSVNREDMYTVGLIGLVSAGKTFNQRKNAAFGTYAAIRIRGALLDELRHQDYLPRHLRTQIKTVQKYKTAYEDEFQRQPSDRDICEHFQLTEKKWNKLKSCLKPRTIVSLNAPVAPHEDSKGATLSDQLKDVRQETAREICEKKELLDLLKLQLQFLSEPEQKILDMRYNEGVFLSEIARRMRMGQSRVWQMHAKAIEKIRRRITRALGQ